MIVEHLALRVAVVERLDYLDLLVSEGDAPSRAALADTEIGRLTDAWRALLDLHTPDERGRCRQCSGRRRSRRHPCAVWLIAHDYLIVEARDEPARPGTESNP